MEELSKLEKKKPVESKDRYDLVEVIKETDISIKDNVTGDFFTDKGVIVEILNKLDRIESRIG